MPRTPGWTVWLWHRLFLLGHNDQALVAVGVDRRDFFDYCQVFLSGKVIGGLLDRRLVVAGELEDVAMELQDGNPRVEFGDGGARGGGLFRTTIGHDGDKDQRDQCHKQPIVNQGLPLYQPPHLPHPLFLRQLEVGYFEFSQPIPSKLR